MQMACPWELIQRTALTSFIIKHGPLTASFQRLPAMPYKWLGFPSSIGVCNQKICHTERGLLTVQKVVIFSGLKNKYQLWPVRFSSVTHSLCFEIQPAGLQSARRISTWLLLTMYSSAENSEPAVTYTQCSPFMEAKSTHWNGWML